MMTRKGLLDSILLGLTGELANTRASPSLSSVVGAPSASSVCLFAPLTQSRFSLTPAAIQLAKLSGFNPIITTASPHNADTLKESGATHVLNRNLSSDALLTEIQKIAAGAPIKTVYDSVSWPDTQNLGYDVLAPGGVIVIDQYPAIEKDKLRSDKRVCMVFGDISIPKHHKLGEALYAKLPQWLTDGSIKARRSQPLLVVFDMLTCVLTSSRESRLYRAGSAELLQG